MDFSKYNQNLSDLQQDIAAAEENSRKFEPIPSGKYEVSIDRLEMKETKAGNALMLSAMMTVLEGPCKNRKMFFNQMLNTGFGIHRSNEFLRSLGTGEKVEFVDFNKYNDMIKAIEFTIHITGLEYEIEYTRTEKDGRTYENYKITEVFEG